MARVNRRPWSRLWGSPYRSRAHSGSWPIRNFVGRPVGSTHRVSKNKQKKKKSRRSTHVPTATLWLFHIMGLAFIVRPLFLPSPSHQIGSAARIPKFDSKILIDRIGSQQAGNIKFPQNAPWGCRARKENKNQRIGSHQHPREKTKKRREGPCGNRTRDLSHPKRESYL